MQGNQKNFLYKTAVLMFFSYCFCLCMALPAQAAGVKAGWKTVKGCRYYYNDEGQKVKGIKRIGKATYYFDKKGIMQTGWRKIKGEYCYFDREKGKQRFNCKVDGIRIKKDGTAKKTKYNKSKIETMMKAHRLMKKLTKPTDSREEKMEKCFLWVSKLPYRRYRFLESVYKQKGWEITFANDIFDKEQGDCVSSSSAAAFLFHECGCKTVYVCHDSEHAWVEYKGKVYDPLFARVKDFKKYYGGTYENVHLWPVAKQKI